MHIKAMNPQVRVTRPGPFAWFFRLVKKAPMEDIDSADAGDVGNKANKGPVDSEELADLKDSLAPISDQLELTRFWWIASAMGWSAIISVGRWRPKKLWLSFLSHVLMSKSSANVTLRQCRCVLLWFSFFFGTNVNGVSA